MKSPDWSGNLDFHEFSIAMMAYEFPYSCGFGESALSNTAFRLGYMMPPYELQRVFMMMDRDHSGRVNEREFAEYWGFFGYP